MTEDNISKSYVGQVEDMKNMSVLIISVAVASMLIVVLSALLHYIDSNSDTYRLMRYFGIRKSRVIALSLQRVSILLISGCALGLFFGYITIFVLGDKLVSVLPGLTIEFMNYYLYLVILLVATILIGSAAIKTQSVIRI